MTKTNCKLVPEVLEYLEQVENGEYRSCPEQIALAAYVRKCFETEAIYTDQEQLANYLRLEKYFPLLCFRGRNSFWRSGAARTGRTADCRDGIPCLPCWAAVPEKTA